MTLGILIVAGLLVLVLLGFWRMAAHYSRVPYRPKPPRDRSKDTRIVWFIGF